MSFCTSCGNQLGGDASFCGKCGTAVVQSQAPESVATNEEGAAGAAMVAPAGSGLARIADSISPVARLLVSGPVFLIAYLVCLVPTYILPYLGSNSALLNGAAAVAGIGGTFQFWLHLGFLWILISLAMLRGLLIGRGWLPALPVIAAAFDMLPGLNWVPFVPTILHLVTLVMGMNRPPLGRTSATAIGVRSLIAAAGLALIALGGLAQLLALNSAMGGPDFAEEEFHGNDEGIWTQPGIAEGGAEALAVPQPESGIGGNPIRAEDYAFTTEELIVDSTPKRTIAQYAYEMAAGHFVQEVTLTDVGVTYNDRDDQEWTVWFGLVTGIRQTDDLVIFLQEANGAHSFSASPDRNLRAEVYAKIQNALDEFKNTHAKYTEQDLQKYRATVEYR